MKKIDRLEKTDATLSFSVKMTTSLFIKEFPLVAGLIYAGISAFILYILYLLKRDRVYMADIIFSIIPIMSFHYWYNENLINSILLGAVVFIALRGVRFIVLYFKKEK